ncbi:GDYXXLXY domain-containing protein [Aliihoeflea sp. PC F10.4]
MKKLPSIILTAVVISLLQIAFIGWMIAGRAAILRDGTDVTMVVEPIDPRDLLRGDYVVLSYPVSALRGDLAPKGARAGDTIYVRVAPAEDGTFRPIAARMGSPPEAALQEGEVDIRGAVRSSIFGMVRSDFGIERFYVPEGEGRGIEGNMRQDRFEVVVAVAADGSAQIRSLLHEGVPIYSDPVF